MVIIKFSDNCIFKSLPSSKYVLVCIPSNKIKTFSLSFVILANLSFTFYKIDDLFRSK